jgi:hypothetical protein
MYILELHIYWTIYLMFVDLYIIVKFIKRNPTRCNNVSKFYYSIFIWSSACFSWHIAHHQEPKTALAASGFLYVEGCWTCSPPTTCPTAFHIWKTRGCQCSFRVPMIGGVSPKTCWASYKYGTWRWEGMMICKNATCNL